MNFKPVFPALGACLLFSGCMATYQSPQQQQQQQALRIRQAEDQRILQESQRRTDGRIETLEMEVARLSRELDSLRQTLDSRTAELERQAAADKQQMIAQLSSQMEKLVKQATPPPSTPTTAHSGMTGIEHVVQEGHTLSAIAKAYGVTTKAIINANNLKNPNVLKVGQKLFIPQ